MMQERVSTFIWPSTTPVLVTQWEPLKKLRYDDYVSLIEYASVVSDYSRTTS